MEKVDWFFSFREQIAGIVLECGEILTDFFFSYKLLIRSAKLRISDVQLREINRREIQDIVTTVIKVEAKESIGVKVFLHKHPERKAILNECVER